MKTNDVFPSKYVKAEDLEGDVEVTIDHVALEEFEDPQTKKRSQKPVCYFRNARKGLILNKTNWALIAKQHGDESDDWAGKKITLTAVDVEAFGDVVSAVRVKLPRQEREAATAGGLN